MNRSCEQFNMKLNAIEYGAIGWTWAINVTMVTLKPEMEFRRISSVSYLSRLNSTLKRHFIWIKSLWWMSRTLVLILFRLLISTCFRYYTKFYHYWLVFNNFSLSLVCLCELGEKKVYWEWYNFCDNLWSWQILSRRNYKSNVWNKTTTIISKTGTSTNHSKY